MPLHLPKLFFLNIQVQIVLVLFTNVAAYSFLNLLLICQGNNYSSPSPYESRLGLLLENLTLSVPHSPSLYMKDSTYVDSSSEIFALAQCLPDVQSLNCTKCLMESVLLVTGNFSSNGCGRTTSAAVLFDLCFLRYSDQRFFGMPDYTFHRTFWGFRNAAHPVRFRSLARNLLSRLSQEAANASSKSAVGMTVTGEQSESKIYGLAWCMMDISTSYCMPCLLKAMEFINLMRVGGRVVLASCLLRFEIYSFFDMSVVNSTIPAVTIDHDGGNGNSTWGKGYGKRTGIIHVIAISEAVALILFFVIFLLLFLRMKMLLLLQKKNANSEEVKSDGCLFLTLHTIKAATRDFSEENKLGRGGFGEVFRGVLRDGQEIAVKRLSKTSLQGVQELENEVAFVAMLQHRNLVRLLACCLEKKEKILVYEFLPNKSLDKLLFDPGRRKQLDWGTRYKIIEGVAQGLLYLHEDSRLRVIHCDLKASNVLLDSSMNPKISDFGFAKLFGINEAQQKTGRIAGTSGYMAPEYAMHGLFSTKSDVYSYGVLVLEIITGRRNICVDDSADSVDVLSYVWHKWKHGQALHAVDPSLGDRYLPEQALRCIQLGLMCIQEDPAQRPNMGSLVVMLSTCSVALPEPSMPTFLDITGFDSCRELDVSGN
ncbi:hypothetical protein HPP92_012008 [Vanilla planifolia]|uniref:Cysteine-rich receptor-like protein kinase 10 n=1 Tax=Vanilla planifolia TaxID=51239 RepID=A0A835V1J9_VANPL|nr:hypothetical protein HPP92_012008 [Vanilla planifolia]